jgi:hypothetical protein
MPPRVASDIVQISMLGRWTNGHPVINVLHYRVDVGVGSINVADEMEDVVQNWQSQLIPEFRDNYTFEGGQYLDLRSADGETGIIPPVVGEPTQGGSTGESSNPNDCVLVHKRTAGARGVRQGRMYLPPPGEGSMDEDGRLTQGAITAMNTRLASFLTNTTQGGISEETRFLTVLHVDNTNTKVRALQVDPLVATQRRRQR